MHSTDSRTASVREPIRTHMLLNDLHHRARHEILTPSFATLAHGEKDLPSVMPIAVVHSSVAALT
jgi:hypothetical protein